jgi:hypothetical protein
MTLDGKCLLMSGMLLPFIINPLHKEHLESNVLKPIDVILHLDNT